MFFLINQMLSTLELKKDQSTDYYLSFKSKGVYISNFKTLYTAFLHSIKLSGYSMRIKFDKGSLKVEYNNYWTKFVNVYIVYDWDNGSNIPLRNFTLKNLLVWRDYRSKNSDK